MVASERHVEADILRNAAELFHKKGYHATSMQDLANAVTLNKATLYHYFPSKEAILLRIHEDIRNELAFRMEEIIASALPAVEKLRRAIQHHIAITAAHQGPMSVLLLEYRDLS